MKKEKISVVYHDADNYNLNEAINDIFIIIKLNPKEEAIKLIKTQFTVISTLDVLGSNKIKQLPKDIKRNKKYNNIK